MDGGADETNACATALGEDARATDRAPIGWDRAPIGWDRAPMSSEWG